MGYSSILKTDFYKVTHMQQYNTGITHFTSYLTPRGSRFKNIDKMVVFGIANFVNEILYKDFNENFFGKHWLDIYEDLIEVLHDGLHYSLPTIKETELKIKKLHELGYLPIELNGLPEGTLCPMGVPAIEIRSTHPDFAWVAQSIESILSCEFWHPAISATMALEYKKIAKEAYDKTVDDDISHMTAMCDFSMRGQESYTSSVASGAAFLTSFYNCSTIESRRYIRENYNDTKPERVNGLTSTEHSVMCSDYAICGDERETFKRLLTEVYPNTSFAAVSDSYDFWNVVTNILPSLREEIEAHNGFIGIRHDSDEPVHALCGIKSINLNKILCGEPEVNNFEDFESLVYEIVNDDLHFDEVEEVYFEYKFKDITYKGVFDIIPYVESYDHKGREWIAYETTFLREERTPEDKGMVESLYELFGGYTNSKGYKVMNPKLKAVYGDSITIPRAKEIYKRLEEKGFAANNVSLGVGSFSMECLEEDGVLKPFTRDSFSIAVKATYCIYNDNGEEKEIFIYKDPKGCSGKKSLKGLCRVVENYKEIKVVQELNQQQYDALKPASLFVNYFKDGNVNKYSFKDIRSRMEDNI
jgi:nicotinamide phosphoribosyltransferase